MSKCYIITRNSTLPHGKLNVSAKEIDPKMILGVGNVSEVKRVERVENLVVGPPGRQGPQGREGPQGVPGPRGNNGNSGSTGSQGPTGPQGEQGLTGPQGERGNDGKDGVNGEDGKQGLRGPQGEKGKDGINGVDGKQGEQGLRGPTGPTGPTGDSGKNGADGKDGVDGIVIFPIQAPIDDKPSYGFLNKDSGLGYSDNSELLLIHNGDPKLKIGKDYVDVCGSLSQVKHKKMAFQDKGTIFTLVLTKSFSYMVNIRSIVTGLEKGDAYYQGIATIKVDTNGDVSLNVPSESVFSDGFSWKWKIGPCLVEFQFEAPLNDQSNQSDSPVYHASGRLDILSSGDTKFICT